MSISYTITDFTYVEPIKVDVTNVTFNFDL